MNGYPVTFARTEFVALGSGALFCPYNSALILADLHLGKSERMARRGGVLLPPFETRDTLVRMQSVIDETNPENLYLLGDVFDDDAARETLSAQDRLLWQTISSSVKCTILAGNHDPGAQMEAMIGDITLRHIASNGPDISGHYHPKARLKSITRPAFLIGHEHLILPAFGTFTGGLLATDPELAALVGSGVIVLTGPKPIPIPFEQQRR